MTMYETSRPSSSSSPASKTPTILGWESLAADLPSRWNRRPISGSSGSCSTILTATGRPSTPSRPRKTREIPPEPSSRTSTNLFPRRPTESSQAHARD